MENRYIHRPLYVALSVDGHGVYIYETATGKICHHIYLGPDSYVIAILAFTGKEIVICAHGRFWILPVTNSIRPDYEIGTNMLDYGESYNIIKSMERDTTIIPKSISSTSIDDTGISYIYKVTPTDKGVIRVDIKSQKILYTKESEKDIDIMQYLSNKYLNTKYNVVRGLCWRHDNYYYVISREDSLGIFEKINDEYRPIWSHIDLGESHKRIKKGVSVRTMTVLDVPEGDILWIEFRDQIFSLLCDYISIKPLSNIIAGYI